LLLLALPTAAPSAIAPMMPAAIAASLRPDERLSRPNSNSARQPRSTQMRSRS
jgi:hypothetical protein